MELIALNTPHLRRDLWAILSDPPPLDLAALVVPKEADSDNPFVRRVYYDGTTMLKELKVDPADIAELRKHSQDGFVQFVNASFVMTAPNAMTTAESRLAGSTSLQASKRQKYLCSSAPSLPIGGPPMPSWPI